MKVVLLEASLRNFILGISKEIKWKAKVVFTGSIVDELHSWHIQGDEMAVESGVTRSIIDEVHFLDIQGDQMEGESMVLLEVTLMNFILVISK